MHYLPASLKQNSGLCSAELFRAGDAGGHQQDGAASPRGGSGAGRRGPCLSAAAGVEGSPSGWTWCHAAAVAPDTYLSQRKADGSNGGRRGKATEHWLQQQCWRPTGRGRRRGRTSKAIVTSRKRIYFSSGLSAFPCLMSAYCLHLRTFWERRS